MTSLNNNFVIGIDGGGTKTTAALADLGGKILKIGKSGSSSPRNIGIQAAARNIVEVVKKVLSKKKIKVTSIFVGLPAVEEEFSSKIGEIKKIISQKVKGKLTIGSDQLVAFRSGTEKKDGIVLIAGTGCVAHGWRGKKEHKSSGWGWLADEGSAFWIGQKYYQAALKGLDGRGPKTRLKAPSNIYSQNFIKEISSLAAFCDLAAKQGDKTAKNILTEAGLELALAVKSVIKKLKFSKEKLPLVLAGSVFKSKVVLGALKKEVKKSAPNVQFIMSKTSPVIGAVKLAIEYAAIS